MSQHDRQILTWYEAHYGDLYEYGCVTTRDPELVSDLLHDLFVWLIEHPQVARSVEQPRAYLMRALAQNIRKHYHTHRRRLGRFADFVAEAPTQTEGAWSEPSVEATLIGAEVAEARGAALRACLDALSSRQREIVYLRYYRRMSFAQIAEQLGIGEQVARNVSSKAMQRLRGWRSRLSDQCLLGLALGGLTGLAHLLLG